MTTPCLMAALLIAASMSSALPAFAQSSGMGVDPPVNAVPQQADVISDSTIDARRTAQDCRDAQAILQDRTISSEVAGGSIDTARAQFDYLKSTDDAAWLLVLQSVDSVYADPGLMRRSFANGRWLALCEGHLHDP